MKKQDFFSVSLVIIAYILPIYFLKQYKGTLSTGESIQYLLPLFLGSILLTYINWKRREGSKFTHYFFKVLGILGFIYSGVVLLLLLSLRDCCEIL